MGVRVSWMELLPEELLVQVLAELPFVDLLAAELCCRRWHATIHQYVHKMMAMECRRVTFGKVDKQMFHHMYPTAPARRRPLRFWFKRMQTFFAKQNRNGLSRSMVRLEPYPFELDNLQLGEVTPFFHKLHSLICHLYLDVRRSRDVPLNRLLKLRRTRKIMIDGEWQCKQLNPLISELCASGHLRPVAIVLRLTDLSRIAAADFARLLGAHSRSLQKVNLYDLMGDNIGEVVTDQTLAEAGDIRKLTITPYLEEILRPSRRVALYDDTGCKFPHVTDATLRAMAQSKLNRPCQHVTLASCNISSAGVFAVIESWYSAVTTFVAGATGPISRQQIAKHCCRIAIVRSPKVLRSEIELMCERLCDAKHFGRFAGGGTHTVNIRVPVPGAETASASGGHPLTRSRCAITLDVYVM